MNKAIFAVKLLSLGASFITGLTLIANGDTAVGGGIISASMASANLALNK